jgi:hypothetical protein
VCDEIINIKYGKGAISADIAIGHACACGDLGGVIARLGEKEEACAAFAQISLL